MSEMAISQQQPSYNACKMHRFSQGRSLRHSTLVALFLLLVTNSGSSQCVPDPIKSDEVEGYAVFGWHNEYRVVELGKIELLDIGNQNRVVASTEINTEGYFKLETLQPGRYVLKASSGPLIPAYVELKTGKQHPRGNAPPKRMLLVIFGADFRRECGGSSITVRPRSNVNRIVREALRPKSQGNTG